MRKVISPEVKLKVALEAIKGQMTWAQICSKYKISQPQVGKLKKLAEQNIISGFATKQDKALVELKEKNEELLKLLGEAQLENSWLKKKIKDLPIDFKRMLIDPRDSMSISHQCRALDLSRSSLYFTPSPLNSFDQILTNKIDEIYTQSPFFGTRRICTELQLQGFEVGRDRIRSAMRTLGIEAIYPKRNLSKPAPNHKVFPYLLRGKIISRPNQVWSADITYVRLAEGFIYLFAIIDWYSRFVVSWKLSPNLCVDFCTEALHDALTVGTPEYFNVDQGSQFTSPHFFEPILDRKIKYSMDGRGRYLDNIFVERLWRSVKYENIFLSGYTNLFEASSGLEKYFDFYNIFRSHQSLENFTPLLKYCDEAY